MKVYWKVFSIFVVLIMLGVSWSEDTLEQKIQDVKKRASTMQVPEPKKDEKATEQAKKAYEYYQSPEFKAQVEQFKKQLNVLLGKELPFEVSPAEQYYSEYKPASGVLSEDERVYIFISSSMPELTIRNYVKEASRIGKNIYLVLRGGIGGIRQLMPTVIWANELLKKNPYCEGQCDMYGVKILIDPFLFKKYSIQKVPAVVYVRGLQSPEGLSEGLSSVKVSNHWVSYGDVSLEYHLKLIGEKAGKNFEQLSSIQSLK